MGALDHLPVRLLVDHRIRTPPAPRLLLVLYLDTAVERGGFLPGADRGQGLPLVLNRTTEAIHSGLIHLFIRSTGAMDPRRKLRHVAAARLVGNSRLLRLPIRVTIMRWRCKYEYNK